MAVAVDFREFIPVDARKDLIRRVEHAPIEHAEAILSAYELLQQLHEKGMLDLLTGVLSAGETVVNHVVGVISSKEMVNMLRMGLIFSNLLSSIDPDKLSSVIAQAGKEPPSLLLGIVKQATSKEARRAMAVAMGLLNVVGAALEKPQAAKHG
jgi:uncharacterized protein YjgD (DUF1641 family)